MISEKTILIVDDEPNILRVLSAVFTKDGYNVVTTDNGRKAQELVSSIPSLQAVLCDLIMPDANGVEVLRGIKEYDPTISVVLMTAHGTIKSAVDAMKLGAFDYVTKPFDIDEIQMVMKNAVERHRLIEENRELRLELGNRRNFREIIGSSGVIQDVTRMVERVADSSATVLIRGESGTGKELVARAVHKNSRRKQQPFIAVSCAALTESLLESELFGHEKGAFTGAIGRRAGRFELAHKGTLFLDEIAEIPPATQVKLLRVLQEREFERVGGTKTFRMDVRLIAATNKDLESCVREGSFREDLYYRLQVIQILMPPLRDRKSDIAALAEHFIEKYSSQNGKRVKFVDEYTLQALMAYSWPGNVRELENVIERGVVLADRDAELITVDLLPASVLSSSKNL